MLEDNVYINFHTQYTINETVMMFEYLQNEIIFIGQFDLINKPLLFHSDNMEPMLSGTFKK